MRREPVESSCLRSVGYDLERQELEVEFHNGRVYRYEEVPADLVLEMLQAKSIGRYFNRVFKPLNFPCWRRMGDNRKSR